MRSSGSARAGTVLRNTGVSRFLCSLWCRRSRPRSARGAPLHAAAVSGPAVVVRCSTWTTHHTGGSSGDIAYRPRTRAADIRRGRPVRGGTVHGSRPSPGERPAAYPGNREAQTPRSPSCGGCNSAALRSDWPGKSSSSNCGSRSWKPTKPKISKAAVEDRPLPIREGDRPKRKPLPDHLPRRAIVHEPVHDGACTCPACGGDNTICAVAEPPTDRRP